MGIKYYHSEPQQIRVGRFLADANGNFLYQFADSKLIKTLPRVTICSILDGNKLIFGFTTCSSKDTYNKKRGQWIAYIRALKKPYVIHTVTTKEDIHDITNKVINEIYELETKRIFHVSDCS